MPLLFFRLSFFTRVESLLRRSINVSQSAKTKAPAVKPAPEIEESTGTSSADDAPVEEEDEGIVNLLDVLDTPLESSEDTGRMYEDLEYRNTVMPDEVGGGAEMDEIRRMMEEAQVKMGHDEL